MASRAEAEALVSKLKGDAAQADLSSLITVRRGVSGVTFPNDGEQDADEGGDEDYDEDYDEDDDPDDLDEDEDDDLDEDEDDDLDEDEDDDLDEDEDDESESYEAVTYRDDDILTVIVDGKQQEVSLGDLKKRYAGEGAIEKRLQEATELRKTAQAEREAVSTELNTHRANLLNTISKLDGVLFMPLVKRPDPALRRTNMSEYLMQQDAYNEDQKRISDLKSTVVSAFETEKTALAQSRNQYRLDQAAKLAEKEPALRDPAQAAQFHSEVLAAVEHYGFTAQQLAEVDNHALLLMARDAGRWIAMQKAKKNSKLPNGGEQKSSKTRKLTPAQAGGAKVRKMKAGGATEHVRASSATKQAKTATATAKKTGSVDAVAAMLAANAKAKMKSSRRMRGH